MPWKVPSLDMRPREASREPPAPFRVGAAPSATRRDGYKAALVRAEREERTDDGDDLAAVEDGDRFEAKSLSPASR